jgi:hypothetical protein
MDLCVRSELEQSLLQPHSENVVNAERILYSSDDSPTFHSERRESLRVLEKIENGFSGICFMMCWVNAQALQRLQCGAEENVAIKYSG